MFALGKPTYIVRTIHDVPFGELVASGVRLVAFDVDNTLTLQGETVLDQKTKELLQRLTGRGIQVFLASNSRRNRSEMASSFGGRFHCPGPGIPRKPSPEYFRKLLEVAGCATKEAVMIGDKYFFDVNPPLALGMKSVLVNPLGDDLIGDKLIGLRSLEVLALSHLELARPR